MASNVDRTQNHRNLWIILGSILGLLVVALILTVLWTCRKRLAKKGLLPTRTVTPLDDAEFESWRRPSQYTQRPQRYTITPRDPPMAERSVTSQHMFDEEFRSMRRNSSPSRPATPPRSHRSSARRQSRASSLQDRPPTPYSARSRPDEQDYPASPTSVTRPKRTHVHYPSVSEASEFDFDFEKRNPDLNFHSGHPDGYQPYQGMI